MKIKSVFISLKIILTFVLLRTLGSIIQYIYIYIWTAKEENTQCILPIMGVLKTNMFTDM